LPSATSKRAAAVTAHSRKMRAARAIVGDIAVGLFSAPMSDRAALRDGSWVHSANVVGQLWIGGLVLVSCLIGSGDWQRDRS
jgi:putative copper export protein